jgi:hypothetical protein
MDIVIDFDGTCVTHEYPRIGKEIGATPILHQLVALEHRLILFTMRSDDRLNQALKWFKERDIPLFGVQTHPEQSRWTNSPKAYGDLYIDDAAVGCPLIYPIDAPPYVDWEKVKKILIETGVI